MRDVQHEPNRERGSTGDIWPQCTASRRYRALTITPPAAAPSGPPGPPAAPAPSWRCEREDGRGAERGCSRQATKRVAELADEAVHFALLRRLRDAAQGDGTAIWRRWPWPVRTTDRALSCARRRS